MRIKIRKMIKSKIKIKIRNRRILADHNPTLNLALNHIPNLNPHHNLSRLGCHVEASQIMRAG